MFLTKHEIIWKKKKKLVYAFNILRKVTLFLPERNEMYCQQFRIFHVYFHLCILENTVTSISGWSYLKCLKHDCKEQMWSYLKSLKSDCKEEIISCEYESNIPPSSHSVFILHSQMY